MSVLNKMLETLFPEEATLINLGHLPQLYPMNNYLVHWSDGTQENVIIPVLEKWPSFEYQGPAFSTYSMDENYDYVSFSSYVNMRHAKKIIPADTFLARCTARLNYLYM